MQRNATRIGIWGGSGSGKSTRKKEMLRSVNRVVVFDPMDEYQEQGYARFDKIPDMGRYMAQNFGNFRACYVPSSGQEVEALHSLSTMVQGMQHGYKSGKHASQLFLSVEEMNLSFPSSIKSDYFGFANLCSRGRHFGINLIGLSQRPNEVNTRFRGNLEHIYMFRLPDKNDQDYAASMFGTKYKSLVRDLKDHHYFYRGKGSKIYKGINALDMPA